MPPKRKDAAPAEVPAKKPNGGAGRSQGKKPSPKIPVEEIAAEWRSQSKRGRYEAAMWKKAGLEQPGS